MNEDGRSDPCPGNLTNFEFTLPIQILKYCSPGVAHFIFLNHNFRSHVATEENVLEAIRLFNVSTMDAARSGINEHMNLTAEMANEIKACD